MAFTGDVIIFIQIFRARWPWSVGTLSVYSSSEVTHLQRPLLRMSPTAGEGILRMEDAVTSEEEDTDSQDLNITIDHCHLKQTQIKKEYESTQCMQASSTVLPLQCVGEKETGKHLLSLQSHTADTRV